MVVATQNPIELDGTYALPEAQRDRFMMRVTIGYPSSDAELQILNTHGAGDAATTLQPVATAQEIAGLIDVVKHLHAADALKEYVVGIVRATREHPAVELGCSPRAGLALLRAGRAAAACLGRDYVVPDDVKALAPHVLSHRLILTPDARMAEVTPESVIADVLGQVPIPRR
jgi:MoxR-like ATPase